MAANNETGVIQPWKNYLKFALLMEFFFHTDATQWIGKIGVSTFSNWHIIFVEAVISLTVQRELGFLLQRFL